MPWTKENKFKNLTLGGNIKKSPISIIYYMNNPPLSTLQIFFKDLKFNNFIVTYFDSKKLFLKVEKKSNLENVDFCNLNEHYSSLLLECNNKVTNLFVIPVAVCINGGILPISLFLRLTKEDTITKHLAVVSSILDTDYILLSEVLNLGGFGLVSRLTEH